MNSGGLRAAEPPAKDRAIAKEPVYESKEPRFCQLVFGPEAKHSVWLVIDGDHLYVDRNGNGNLTEEGKRFLRRPAFLGGGFVMPELAIGDGPPTYTNLIVYWSPQPSGQQKKEFPVEVLVDVNKQYCQWADFRAIAGRAKDAPVIQFGGPLEMILHADEAPIPAPEKERPIGAVIGTRSSTGHLAMVRNDRNLAPNSDIHPLAEITFPAKAGADPVPIKLTLDQRCCNARFFTTLRTPAEIGSGKAKVLLSFPAWTDVKVTPATRELAIEKPVSENK
jgi:hypothetical protein